MPLINGIWRPVLTFPITSANAAVNNVGRAALLLGYSFAETTGNTPCAFDIMDGNTSGGTLVSPITLDGGQSRQDELGPDGVFCQMGPFINAISGAWRGALFLVDLPASQYLTSGAIGQ